MKSQDLDSILSELYNIYPTAIVAMDFDALLIDRDDVWACVRELANDGHVHESTVNAFTFWSLTTSGKYFFECGGYTALAKKELKDLERQEYLHKLEVKAKKTQIFQGRFTVIISLIALLISILTFLGLNLRFFHH